MVSSEVTLSISSSTAAVLTIIKTSSPKMRAFLFLDEVVTILQQRNLDQELSISENCFNITNLDQELAISENCFNITNLDQELAISENCFKKTF